MSTLCPPCARLSALTVLGACPPCGPSMPLDFVALGLLRVRAAASSSNFFSLLRPLVACCGAGPWHHEVKFFLSIAEPTAFILHARWSVSLAVILAPQIRPLRAHPMLEKLFGVYAGIIFSRVPRPFFLWGEKKPCCVFTRKIAWKTSTKGHLKPRKLDVVHHIMDAASLACFNFVSLFRFPSMFLITLRWLVKSDSLLLQRLI